MFMMQTNCSMHSIDRTFIFKNRLYVLFLKNSFTSKLFWVFFVFSCCLSLYFFLFVVSQFAYNIFPFFELRKIEDSFVGL